MTVGHEARGRGQQHDSAARRLDEAQRRQRRLVDRLAPERDHAGAQESLSAGRAGIASLGQWLHWVDAGESLEPWADGEWAPAPGLAPGSSWVAPALPASVGRLRERLAAFATAHRVGTAVIADLQLGASEAITNAVLHAYRDRPLPGTVTASIGIAAGRIEVIVTDGGLGMSPRPDSPGAGLGLSVMSAVSDQMTLRPGMGGEGTEVRLIFALR
ncbi:MAG TPA: ATP-binding protein [Solirubrobacteraceae bacterium]|jgi:anti-sigma regulatory factor (Ser/Thr protein kinase)